MNPAQQRELLLGLGKGSSSEGASSAARIKREDEITGKMLEDLKARVLTQRDHFILSNKDELPQVDKSFK